LYPSADDIVFTRRGWRNFSVTNNKE